MMSPIKTMAQWRNEKLLEFGSPEQWEMTRKRGFIRFVGRYAAIVAAIMIVVMSIIQFLTKGRILLEWFDLVAYSILGYIFGGFVWQQNNHKYRKEKAKAQLKIADPHLLD